PGARKGSANSALPTFLNPETQAAGDDDDDTSPALNLARFVYLRGLSSSKQAVPRPVVPPEAPDNATKRPVKRKPTHRFADEFSDADLARLRKCVSCHIQWTARKTAKQK